MTNIAEHDAERKKYQRAYNMSTMTSYEHYVDDCVALFTQRLHEMAKMGNFVDMAWWLQCFAFDVIGEITFSKRFGFLDQGEDVNGLVQTVHGHLKQSSHLGIYNEFLGLLFAVVDLLSKLGFSGGAEKMWFAQQTESMLNQRKVEVEKAAEAGHDLGEQDDGSPKDFLTKFMEAHQKDPNHVTKTNVLLVLQANVSAGSDTTSITLSAILYSLLHNPQTLHKLRQEIAGREQAGTLSDPVTFKESQSMEYLQAVIKEGLRLHPAVGTTLPRVVPEGGAVISGQYFPAGQVVGMNPYVAHYNKDVFGPDAAEFRPERWLKSHTDEETLSKMEHSWLAFGYGSRNCLGKNVSLLEIGKLVPQLVRKFDFEFGDELKRDGWQTENWFFVMPQNLLMRVREKEVVAS